MLKYTITAVSIPGGSISIAKIPPLRWRNTRWLNHRRKSVAIELHVYNTPNVFVVFEL